MTRGLAHVAALGDPGYTRHVAQEQVVAFEYINHQGHMARRRVLPERIWFGSTDWHREPQWLLEGFDCDRQAVRCFAMRDIRNFAPDTASHVSDGQGSSSAAR